MRCYTLGLFIGLVGCANANDVPKDLLYHGQPIDALCFAPTGGGEPGRINLSKCGMSVEKYVSDNEDGSMKKQGFIGTSWKDNAQNYPAQGYSYYNYFNAGNGQYWIYSINNTGGSGSFTLLMLVKRINLDTLEYKTFLGGDRCNGGIADVISDTNGQLKVSVNLTPYDIYNPTAQKNTKLNAYDDLAACASCCTAKANYEVDKDKPKFKSISLNQVKSIDELPTQGSYQKCFNQLYMEYLKKGQNQLTEEQAKTFVTQFNHSCVKK